MTDTLNQRIAKALSRIRNPRTGHDIVADDMVRDVATTTDGKVRLTLLLDAADPATLVRDVRLAVEHVEGVNEVHVDVKDAAQAPPPPSKSRALPVMDDRPAAPRASAPTPVAFPELGHIIAVSSGKGGVG
ncbi:MAG: DUF59 domain-containing protein, partial [Gemmatimonadota bacterium]|nr:DUF59 domain-containing protein [Gemmatimonadota bacterium]